MSAQTETEAKFLVSAEDYTRLMSLCRVERTLDQVNAYFDSGLQLARFGATCRIRFLPNAEPLFTLKLPRGTTSDGARRSLELELPLSSAFESASSRFPIRLSPTQLVSAIQTALYDLGISELNRIGRMRNLRRELRCEWGSFELDTFRLPDGRRMYEVEIEEANESVRAQLVAFVRERAPTAEVSRLSKFQRFTQALGTKSTQAAGPRLVEMLPPH